MGVFYFSNITEISQNTSILIAVPVNFPEHLNLGSLQPGKVFKSMTNSSLQTIKPSMSADPSRLDVNILMAMGFPKKQQVDKQLLYTEKN